LNYKKPNILCYRIAQAASWLVSTLIFKRKILRNEIKDKQGPFVVIANHEAALDFVNLIGTTKRPMTFVISNSFFSTLPIKGFLTKMGVIPKQQFQTTADDLKRIKTVINKGQPVVLYPAGLMCEDGLSTPIPAATYKFLKWLDADVYVARSIGTYFVMPKWAKGLRPGRTFIDIYKLFSREELAASNVAAIKEKTDEAILFDAYREQESCLSLYKNAENVSGLENVLYQCPHCAAEFSIEVIDGNTLRCKECGFAHISDEYAFLHPASESGAGFRYVSDWSRFIYDDLKRRILAGEEATLSAKTRIHMIDHAKHKFVDVGHGTVTLSADTISLHGQIRGESVHISVPIGGIPTLPFSPGKHFEIQHGQDIYRCVLAEGKLVMKYINIVKIFFAINHAASVKTRSAVAP